MCSSGRGVVSGDWADGDSTDDTPCRWLGEKRWRLDRLTRSSIHHVADGWLESSSTGGEKEVSSVPCPTPLQPRISPSPESA